MQYKKNATIFYRAACLCLNGLFANNSSTAERKDVLIFFDKGVSIASAFGLMISVRQALCGEYRVKLIDSHQLLNAPWEEQAKLLIFPGGKARPFYDALGAEWVDNTVPSGATRVLRNEGFGNQRIKDFVAHGGGYLGICAGAYYGSAKTVFEKGGPLEVMDEGALKFYSGKAEGPAYGLNKFAYKSRAGLRLAKVKYSPGNGSNFLSHVYFNGGCFFSDKSAQSRTLAVYDDIKDSPPAIIDCHFGRGRAVLSGVHLEMRYWMLPIYSLRRPRFFKMFRDSQDTTQRILKQILDLLLVRTTNQEQRMRTL